MELNKVKKIILSIVIVIALLALGVFMGKDLIAKSILLSALNRPGGPCVNVKAVNVGILRSYVSIKNLELYNPEGYSDRLMADFPEIYVDYSPRALFSKKLHLEEVRLHLKTLTIVRNKDRLVNVDSLAVVDDIKKDSRAKEKGAKVDLNGFHIDLLQLKIGKVIWKDYSKGGIPDITEYNIDIDEEFRDISNPYGFVSLLIAKSFTKTPVGMLAEFDLTMLKAKAGELIEGYGKAAGKVAQETAEKTKDALRKILPIPR